MWLAVIWGLGRLDSAAGSYPRAGLGVKQRGKYAHSLIPFKRMRLKEFPIFQPSGNKYSG